jgi:putative membrane protein
MTYFQFHSLFNLPLATALCLINALVPWSNGEIFALAITLLAAAAFTTPWDNFAVMWGIWDFPRHRYWFRLGYLPIEEYLFFLLQTFNVILGCRAILWAWPSLKTGLATPLTWTHAIQAGVIVFSWLMVGAWYLYHLPKRSHYYALHLLFWFLPVIILQWVLAPHLMAAHAGFLAIVSFGFGFYYILADLVAVRAGTWYFDEEMNTGFLLFGILPWEEAAFFFLTSLLVAQSYLLLLPPSFR